MRIVTRSQVEQSFGKVDDDDVGVVLDDEHHRDERAAVEHEQVVRGIRLHRDDATEHGAGAVADLGADDLVHPHLAGHGVARSVRP